MDIICLLLFLVIVLFCIESAIRKDVFLFLSSFFFYTFNAAAFSIWSQNEWTSDQYVYRISTFLVFMHFFFNNGYVLLSLNKNCNAKNK